MSKLTKSMAALSMGMALMTTSYAQDKVVTKTFEIPVGGKNKEVTLDLNKILKEAGLQGKFGNMSGAKLMAVTDGSGMCGFKSAGMHGFKGFGMNQEKLPNVYVGAVTSKVSTILAAQLGIEKGAGIGVRSVSKGGPASKAGLQADDVLYKLNDQILVNTAQLLVLLDSYKVGDKVTFSYYRKGQLKKATVALEKRKQAMPFKMKVLNGGCASGCQIGPKGHNFNVNGVNVAGLGKEIQKRLSDGGVKLKSLTPGSLEELDLGLLEGIAPKAKMAVLMDSIIKTKDKNGSYVLKKTKKGLHFEATGNDGKKIFSGLVEPKENLQKLPADLQKKVKNMTHHLNSLGAFKKGGAKFR